MAASIAHGIGGETPAADGRRHGPLHAATITPLLSTMAIQPQYRFPIPSWAPRSGRTEAYELWLVSIHQLLAAFGLTMEQLHEETPDNPLFDDSLVRTKSDHHAARDDHAALVAARDAWLLVDTSVYWHVRPSIDVAGPDLQKDTRKLDSLYCGRVAKGRKLLLWAMHFADMGALAQQHNLLAGLLGPC